VTTLERLGRERRHAAGDVERTAEVLEVAGGLALVRGDATTAAVLLGAGNSLRTDTAGARDPLDSEEFDADVAAARATLGDDGYAAACARAARMDLAAAVTLAREVLTQPR